MLHKCSMLADLTIHRWTATKHDASVSAEVERNHSAKNAGRFNKLLIDKEHLAEIDTLGNQLRTFHYKHTLPWSDKGARILPTKLFTTYQDGFADLRDKRDAAVEAFLQKYPTLVQDARTRLNTMFDPFDYPPAHELRRSFGVDLELMPVPNADDFRVDLLNDSMQTAIRRDIMTTVVWTGSLLFWSRVVNQRVDSHAQLAAQELGKQISAIVAPLFPVSWKELTGRSD